MAVAPALLGRTLTSTIGPTVVLRITEVEAYGGVGEDPGSHAFRRRTPRNASMFDQAGTAYVYFTYGMHWCLNVVAHDDGHAGAVLIRAGEVVAGAPAARSRRGISTPDRDLARGPARLAAALGVTGELDGTDLLSGAGPLQLSLMQGPRDQRGDSPAPEPTRAATPSAEPPSPPPRIRSGPRVGVAGAGAQLEWRFWLVGDPTVSAHRAAAPPRQHRSTP